MDLIISKKFEVLRPLRDRARDFAMRYLSCLSNPVEVEADKMAAFAVEIREEERTYWVSKLYSKLPYRFTPIVDEILREVEKKDE